MNQVSESGFLRQIRGKDIAVVGAAESITGSGSGAAINGYDLVVRINAGYNVPEGMRSDLGTRTDVVYHTGVTNTRDGTGHFEPIENGNREGIRNLETRDLQEIHRSGCSLMFLVVPRFSRRVAHLREISKDLDFPWSCFREDTRTRLHQQIGTLPNTGVLAAWHILQSPGTSVSLYGFDFFETPHHKGYNDETDEYRLTAGTRPTDKVHCQQKQLDFVGRLWSESDRVQLQPHLEAKMRSRGWTSFGNGTWT